MKMFVSERRNKILELLQEKNRLTVKELAFKIGVSEATLRSDLNIMEADGLLTRTHGGAILNENLNYGTSFSIREKRNQKEKILIAEEAMKFIEEKQCILLDASSTALELAHKLQQVNIRLTVVTSGVRAALELNENPNITVILIGGMMTKGSSSIEGKMGLNVLNQVNIDIMFTSASGFTIETGLTDFNLYEVELKQELVKKAKIVIALVDKSKIGTNSSAVFATTEEINTIITDAKLDDQLVKNISDRGVNFIDLSETK